MVGLEEVPVARQYGDRVGIARATAVITWLLYSACCAADEDSVNDIVYSTRVQ